MWTRRRRWPAFRASPDDPLHAVLPQLDAVLTYGGGDPVVQAYLELGAKFCAPVYNGLDPETHHPVPPQPRFAADLGFLGNRLPDREQRVEQFFLGPASARPGLRYLLGGAGWGSRDIPVNVTLAGHVGTAEHNAFNVSAKAVLNISRDGMAAMGFSPATRVFEAAGAGACLITDDWPGIDQFFSPGTEILVARDGQEVLEIMDRLQPADAHAIGQAALARVLAEHTYLNRACTADGLFRMLAERRRAAHA